MADEVIRPLAVGRETQAAVARMVGNQVGRRARDQHVATDVELTVV